jgi:hypothetical protein
MPRFSAVQGLRLTGAFLVELLAPLQDGIHCGLWAPKGAWLRLAGCHPGVRCGGARQQRRADAVFGHDKVGVAAVLEQDTSDLGEAMLRRQIQGRRVAQQEGVGLRATGLSNGHLASGAKNLRWLPSCTRFGQGRTVRRTSAAALWLASAATCRGRPPLVLASSTSAPLSQSSLIASTCVDTPRPGSWVAGGFLSHGADSQPRT